jgi:DNA-binding CsgD family transcriptional regulator
MPADRAGQLELAEALSSGKPIAQRAQAALGALRPLVPYDGAWMALADPRGETYTAVADADLDEPTLEFLSGPLMAADIEVTGTNRRQPPVTVSDLPFPATELPTWADCLIPAGYHEALAVALYEPGGRHVGFLALLYDSDEPPPAARRRRLDRLTPVLARGVDPMRSLAAAARLVRGATAGVVIRADGDTEALPGLAGHALLTGESPVLAAARARLRRRDVYTSFLWPLGGRHAPDGHTRVTVLAGTEDVPPHLAGIAVLSPADGLRGLTPRELEVLGLLVDGCSNQEIARVLVVAQRTVAAHLEHILVKLAAPTRTLAAVRADRGGLYVPVPRRMPCRNREARPGAIPEDGHRPRIPTAAGVRTAHRVHSGGGT